jgi:hypothetical protein
MLVVNNNDDSFFSNIFKRDSIGSETRRILIKYIRKKTIIIIINNKHNFAIYITLIYILTKT